jgi:hypothetical protein
MKDTEKLQGTIDEYVSEFGSAVEEKCNQVINAVIVIVVFQFVLNLIYIIIIK